MNQMIAYYLQAPRLKLPTHSSRVDVTRGSECGDARVVSSFQYSLGIIDSSGEASLHYIHMVSVLNMCWLQLLILHLLTVHDGWRNLVQLKFSVVELLVLACHHVLLCCCCAGCQVWLHNPKWGLEKRVGFFVCAFFFLGLGRKLFIVLFWEPSPLVCFSRGSSETFSFGCK